jgi:hypothetical protein
MASIFRKDRVSALLAGWRRARQESSTAFLNADVSLETLGYDPKNLQLNEARQYLALELCRAIGFRLGSLQLIRHR